MKAYPTNAEVTFLAVSEEKPDPGEFLWDFGDSSSIRTTSGSITKKYTKPGRLETKKQHASCDYDSIELQKVFLFSRRYNVVLLASSGGTWISSDVFSLVIQRPVRLNQLRHRASVLANHTVTVICRVSAGTEVSFLWNFGDGSSRPGQRTEQHVFQT